MVLTQLPESAWYVGVEPSEAARAVPWLGTPPAGRSARLMELTGLPDHQLDLLVVRPARPLPDDLDRMLAQWQRVLRPGGRLAVFLPKDPEVRRVLRARLAQFFEGTGDTTEVWSGRRRPTGDVAQHFDELAPQYARQIPPHIQATFLEKKLQRIMAQLPADPSKARVLDVGCGIGRYAKALAERTGAQVVGVDASMGNLRQARTSRAAPGPLRVIQADVLRLPFRNASFDLVYSINVLHHLKRGEQERALRELSRLLKPDGRLVVLEMNLRNPLFRWYMRKVFPRTRRIDRGDEEFIAASRWPLVPELALDRLDFFTFTPDFAPRWLSHLLRPIERRLERGSVATHAIHYAAILRRTSATA